MYNNKFKLPVDLREYSSKWAAKKLLPCLAMFFALFAVLFFWGDIIVPTDVQGFATLVYLIILSVPFVVFGVPHKLIDKTYFAKVTKVWVKTTYVQDKYRVKQSTGYHSGGVL